MPRETALTLCETTLTPCETTLTPCELWRVLHVFNSVIKKKPTRQYTSMSTTHTLLGAMNDGRFATDYTPSCVSHTRFAQSSNVKMSQSNVFRSQLQDSGMQYLKSMSACGPLACKDHGMSIQEATTAVVPPYTEE